jgi:hypothetical protein
VRRTCPHGAHYLCTRGHSTSGDILDRVCGKQLAVEGVKRDVKVCMEKVNVAVVTYERQKRILSKYMSSSDEHVNMSFQTKLVCYYTQIIHGVESKRGLNEKNG